MANSLSGVKDFMTAVLAAKPWNRDPTTIRKPWDEDEWNLCEHGGVDAQLCFAIMWDNEVVKPHPPLVRAMRMTKAALEKMGHKGKFLPLMVILARYVDSSRSIVIDWKPHRHLEIYKNAVRTSFLPPVLTDTNKNAIGDYIRRRWQPRLPH
jgi:amidase